jgi:trk system potassium uptake protein TrkH
VQRVTYVGRAVEEDVIAGLILLITGYVLILGLAAVAMTLLGLDPMSALWGAWTSIGNIGYGLGPLAAEANGTFAAYPTAAKWIMILAMLLGRLGLLAVLVVFMPRFWRD